MEKLYQERKYELNVIDNDNNLYKPHKMFGLNIKIILRWMVSEKIHNKKECQKSKAL